MLFVTVQFLILLQAANAKKNMSSLWGLQAQNQNDASQEQLIPDHGEGRFFGAWASGDTQGHIPLHTLPPPTRNIVEDQTVRQQVRLEKQSDSNDCTKTPKTTPKSGRRGTIAAWVPEVLSLFLAVLSLVAMVVILVKFNRQQQPEWSFSSTVNLSTIIALLAAMTQSMVGLVTEAGTPCTAALHQKAVTSSWS